MDPRTPPNGIDAQARESQFGIDELFFSVTDRRGIIRSGNSVFVRVSKFDETELVGRPHSIIRHPDMPRAVFKVLWDFITAGKTIAALVKNQAKDGSFYWVVATVAPVEDGYLSVRFKPSSPLLGVVEKLYQEIRGFERDLERQKVSRRALVDASTARLVERLHTLGFDSYEAFMRTMLADEIRSRAAARGHIEDSRSLARFAAVGHLQHVQAVLDSGHELHAYLDSLFSNLDRYIALNQSLSKKADFVLELAEDIRLFSLNTILSATRLSDAATLEEVASLMRGCTVSTSMVITALHKEIAGTVQLLRGLNFEISVAKVQAEMVTFFANELIIDQIEEPQESLAHVRHDIRDLAHCLDRGLGHVFGSLSALDRGLHAIGLAVDGLLRDLRALSVLQVTGRVEAARIPGGSEFAHLFDALRERIASARHEVDGFAEVVARGREGVPVQQPTMLDHLRQMVVNADRLAA